MKRIEGNAHRARVVGNLAMVLGGVLAAGATRAQFDAAGPDAFGHMGNRMPYNLRDIRATGDPVVLTDDETLNWPLGFDFDYFGTTFDSVFISSNGFLSFSSNATGCCTAVPLPGGSIPDMISPGWTDLDPTEGGTIHAETRGEAGSREFVVGYYDVQHNLDFIDGNTPSTFEIILHEGSNNIEFQYLQLLQNLTANGTEAMSIGIQNGPINDGLQVAYFATSAPGSDVLRSDSEGYLFTTVTDLGSASKGRLLPANQALKAGEIRWFRFDVPETIDEIDNRFLTIDTLGSLLMDDNDTQIALYNASGALIAEDDDDGSDFLSRLSFGDADGNLPAGQYYVVASGFFSAYGQTGFDAVSTSTETGDISVNLLYGTDVGVLKQGRFAPADQSLSAEAVRWFRFDLSESVPDRFLIIDTQGSSLTGNNDTEIGLYDAEGNRVDFDDDGGGNLLSRLLVGGKGAGLTDGQYFLAASAFNTEHGVENFDVQSSATETGSISVNFLQGSDVGMLQQESIQTPAQPLAATEVQFYRFELSSPISTADERRLVIDTLGSMLTTDNDTEIGLYDETGNLIATNDDAQFGVFTSRLAFGDAVDSSGDLPAGVYFLAASGFNSTFSATDFAVTSASSRTGDIVLTFAAVLLAGDYNGDGTVNAADYTVWRNSLNLAGESLPADGNGDGLITRDDFDVWKAHYGESLAGGASLNSSPAVPEPAAIVIFLASVTCVAGGRRRR
jgi:hypothetical protein